MRNHPDVIRAYLGEAY
ncbi:MAG: hypothetical protein ACRCS2_11475 [Morganella morganii]